MQYSLKEIATITGGKLTGKDISIRRIVTDSRVSTDPEGSVFFALKGQRHDGHTYIPDLYHSGIRAFVVSELKEEFSALADASFISVPDTLAALQQFASAHRRRFSCPVIAITGSNGKTIVKEWLNFCLAGDYILTRSPKSYNSQLGVPLSVMLLDEGSQLAIFEAGISQPGEMQKLQVILKPDIGIFTTIGEAHQENFQSLRQKVREKLVLFKSCPVLIYCHDHDLIREEIQSLSEMKDVRTFTWSIKGDGDIQVSHVIRETNKTYFRVSWSGHNIELSIPFTDPASFENAMHCVALLLWMHTDVGRISERLNDLPPIAMRLEQKSAINDCTLINDSYNSDINSLSIALDLLNRQTQHQKKTVILSDIFQSGKSQPELYSMVASMMQEKGVSRLIGIGASIKANGSHFTGNTEFFETTPDYIAAFNPENYSNEAILLKGSRHFEFERIAALLEQKKHTTRIEVNLGALAHNLNYFRSLLKPGTKTMVMVKALSYGSGRHEIANVLQFQRVDYLGVAFADEGMSLRQAGITLPIIVMNPEPESFDVMIRHRLEPEVYSFRILDMFNQALGRNQEIGYPVHIKIDTGMHRLGFAPAETRKLGDELSRLRSMKAATVFSHLAGSDEETHDAFTRQQVDIFTNASGQLIEALDYPVIRHILNSSGIERFPEAQFEMVRLGIGLYGISNVAPEKLRNVSTLKSTVLQVKPVFPGDTVGYGRKGVIGRPSEIAIVPVGYADGINRKLGNGSGRFLVKGLPVPIIGNVCMDMTILDVTGIHAKEGDEVIIFGDEHPVTDLAGTLETIPYEILTSISERVKRIYLYE